MEHDIVRKYSDDRVLISGWSERIQQYPYDCPRRTAGQAAYRTFGYTTKHFLPRTTTQEANESVWKRYLEKRQQERESDERRAAQEETDGWWGSSVRPEVNHWPYISNTTTTYQHDYFDPFPAFRKLMMINAMRNVARSKKEDTATEP